MNKSRDIINVLIGDMHSGSDRALFPPVIELPPLMADEKKRVVRYSHTQKPIYDHFIKCAKHIKTAFPKHKKVFIPSGDSIEGVHHYTIQLSVPTIDDHVLVHQALMEEFLDVAGFSVKNGDELHYISGTETHTQYKEPSIAEYFSDFGAKFHDELKVHQNGRDLWFVHQWAGVGKGANEGNPITLALKSMYYDSLKEGWKMPDVVVGSHFHKASLGSWSQDWRTFHGMITPSWQLKTRFGQKVSAFQRNDIGMGLIETSASGLVGVRRPMLMAKG